MTKQQAERLARQKWNGDAILRYNRRHTPLAVRESAQQALKEHRAKRPVYPYSPHRTTEERTALHPAWVVWRDRERELMDIALGRHPYEIGYRMRVLGAFAVHGYGYSWEEACKRAGLVE